MTSHMSAISHATHIGNIFDQTHCCGTFEDDTILQKVFHFFSAQCPDCVIITHKSVPMGILTLKDLVRVVHSNDNLGLPVKEFMSTPLQSVDSTVNIGDVLDLMQHTEYDKIVVVEENSVIGVIDRRHLLALCYTQLTPMIRHEQTMIHSLMGLVGEGEKGLLKMATTDVLTGIGNRRLFEEIFQSYQQLEDRDNISLFLLLFDVDNFKSVNDTFGHNVGDSVLKELASLIGHSIRKSDIFVRWGGEEFAILQRYSDPTAVMKVAEQIRKKIDHHSFETIVHVTCSFGLTKVMPDENLESAFERADQALYRAKKDGKNCIRIEKI